MPAKKITVCYILSYKAPNYTRTATLLAALRQLPEVEVTAITNTSTGVVRYWQTFSRLVKYRLHHKPDVCIVGFRGQEIFGLLYPFMRGSRIIFDEFINMHDWFVNEHHKLKEGSLPVKLLDSYTRWIFRRSTYVLADTPAHARLSAGMYDLPDDKIVAVPVGAEEGLFRPRPKTAKKNTPFEVFFYGNMLPLHGLTVILDAIRQLKKDDLEGMHFTLVGGRGKPEMIARIETFITENDLDSYITHLPWVEYKKLPEYIANADICLGGPFGGTGQARRVVTGKTYQFLAMGKPTIIGETENTGVFSDKQNCLIVHQQDPAALAAAFVWAHEHREKLESIGKSGQVLYAKQFSSEVIAHILVPLLEPK